MRTQPPGPTGLPVLGTAREFSRDPFAFMSECAAAYGEVVRFDLGPMETYMVTDPSEIERVLVSEDHKYHKPSFQGDALGELLGNGLLLSEEGAWQQQRRLAQPAFAPGRLMGLGDVMTGHVEDMLDGWSAGDVRDVEADMARVTVHIIVEAMLGASLDQERVQVVRENLEPLGRRFEPDPLRPLIPDWAPTRENREYHAAIEELEGLLGEVLAERRGTQYDAPDPGSDDGQPMDLLSVLLRAQDRGEQTDEQLRDEMMTMLLAGHDTTALTLTYTWYLLSEHPEVEARVHAEIDEVLGDDQPTAEAVQDLEFTENVINEAMRLYPPVYAIFREPQVDVKLGGYRVPEDASVLLPQWVVHRSPRYWDDPERFDPDRWDRDVDRPRFAYFPFGGGPRHCIGKALSLLEAKLIVASVGQRYSLRRVDDGPLDLRPSLTMHPTDGMEMAVEPRE
jgi:cytochrome P450